MKKILELLHSTNSDDIILGLRILHETNTKEEIANFFLEYRKKGHPWIDLPDYSIDGDIYVEISNIKYIIFNGGIIISTLVYPEENFLLYLDDHNQKPIKF